MYFNWELIHKRDNNPFNALLVRILRRRHGFAHINPWHSIRLDVTISNNQFYLCVSAKCVSVCACVVYVRVYGSACDAWCQCAIVKYIGGAAKSSRQPNPFWKDKTISQKNALNSTAVHIFDGVCVWFFFCMCLLCMVWYVLCKWVSVHYRLAGRFRACVMFEVWHEARDGFSSRYTV